MIRLAVAGAGAWGRNHIRSLASLRGTRLDWVIDPDATRLGLAAELAPQARLTTDAGEVLADRRVDGLVVASPTPTHVPLARAALDAGKHVLCEKPLAPDADQAWALVRHARKRQRLLSVGHLLLYHPAVVRLKRMIDADRFGRVHYLVAQRTNLGRIRTDEGTLTSLGPHDVSVMVHLLGAWPIAVSAHGAAYLQPRWEDVVFLTLRFPGGVLGHIHLSWLDPDKVRRISLVGARRMAVFDDMEADAKLVIHDKSALAGPTATTPPGEWPVHSGRTRVLRLPDHQPLLEELRAFVRCIREGRESRTPGEDGARVLRVLDAAQASLAQGGAENRVKIR